MITLDIKKQQLVENKEKIIDVERRIQCEQDRLMEERAINYSALYSSLHVELTNLRCQCMQLQLEVNSLELSHSSTPTDGFDFRPVDFSRRNSFVSADGSSSCHLFKLFSPLSSPMPTPIPRASSSLKRADSFVGDYELKSLSPKDTCSDTKEKQQGLGESFCDPELYMHFDMEDFARHNQALSVRPAQIMDSSQMLESEHSEPFNTHGTESALLEEKMSWSAILTPPNEKSAVFDSQLFGSSFDMG